MKKILTVFLISLFVGAAHGQVIDETIARELGLVKSPSSTIVSSNTKVVELNVGQMRELIFPEQGTLNLKAKDKAKFEDILNINNSVYITPKQPLTEPAIGVFVLKESKRSYVLNFKTTTATVQDNSMVIGTPVNTAIIDQSTPTIKRLPVPGKSFAPKRTEYDLYAELAAFGSRSAYSSERTTNPPKGLAQVSLPRRIKDLKTLTRDQRIKVRPLSAWQKKGVYLTVVELENTGSEPLELTPDLIRGNFIGRMFEHNRLGTDQSNKYTALYLISQAPIEVSLWR